jgi:hypothetical protein
MMSYVPAGWPSAVYPPGSEAFQESAVAWLLDVLPSGYREQKRVQRYPIGLAVIARHHTEACVDGARQGYRTIRAELDGWLSPSEVEAVLAVYGTEGAARVATARAVGLVVQALNNEGFRPLL